MCRPRLVALRTRFKYVSLAQEAASPRRHRMSYRAPVPDIAFTLKHAAGFASALANGLYGDLTEDVVDAVLVEAGRFATDVIAPLNAVGDRQGAQLKDGAVTTPN